MIFQKDRGQIANNLDTGNLSCKAALSVANSMTIEVHFALRSESHRILEQEQAPKELREFHSTLTRIRYTNCCDAPPTNHTNARRGTRANDRERASTRRELIISAIQEHEHMQSRFNRSCDQKCGGASVRRASGRNMRCQIDVEAISTVEQSHDRSHRTDVSRASVSWDVHRDEM